MLVTCWHYTHPYARGQGRGRPGVIPAHPRTCVQIWRNPCGCGGARSSSFLNGARKRGWSRPIDFAFREAALNSDQARFSLRDARSVDTVSLALHGRGNHLAPSTTGNLSRDAKKSHAFNALSRSLNSTETSERDMACMSGRTQQNGKAAARPLGRKLRM